MPGIDLSTVSGPDLRRLLKMAHIRHEGLLADQLEWEIAARRARRDAGPLPRFTKSAEDDRDVPDAGMAASKALSVAPDAQQPASARRSVLLVTLGALAGGLISAAAFWGLARMDGPPQPPRAQFQPAARPEPVQPQALAVAPEAPAPAPVEASVPAPSVEVAKQTTRLAMKRKAVPSTATATTVERPPPPPTLDEWLAKPSQHIDPEEPPY